MLTRMRLEVSNAPAAVDAKVTELQSMIASKPQIAADLATF